MKHKHILYLGLAAYAAMLLLAWVYYKERVISFDTGCQLFDTLFNTIFMTDRYGAVVTRLLPALCAAFEAPFEYVLRTYSLNFPLFYFASFLILLLVFKNPRLALVQLLINTMMVSHSFYWIQCEIVPGLSYLLLFWAAAEKILAAEKNSVSKGYRTLFGVLAPILLAAIVVTYPLLVFGMMFLLAFLGLRYPGNWRLLLGIGAVYAVLYVVKTIFFVSTYDRDAMMALSNIVQVFPNYLTMEANRRFLLYCVTDYYFVPLLLVASSVFYWKKKETWKLLLVNFFFFGVLFLININHPEGCERWYIESQLLLLSLFVSVPLAYDLLASDWFGPVRSAGLIALIVGVGLVRMQVVHKGYTERLDWYRDLIRKTDLPEGKKWVVSVDDLSDETKSMLLSVWGCAFEVWMLSTLESGVTRSIVIEETPHEFDAGMKNNRVFITKWISIDYSQLQSSPYFVTTDTSYYRHWSAR